jgi:hypothetical protein
VRARSTSNRLTQFANVRRQSYLRARAELQTDLPAPVRLASVNADTLAAWEKQWPPHQPDVPIRGGWDWTSVGSSYLQIPDAFHLAIWSDSTLCGLAVGTPTRARQSLVIDCFEGSPDSKHPLKGFILPLVLMVGDAYAAALGATRLRLRLPDKTLIPTYEALGFELHGPEHGVWCCDRGV